MYRYLFGVLFLCLVLFVLAYIISSLECGLCIAAPLDKPTRTARGAHELRNEVVEELILM